MKKILLSLLLFISFVFGQKPWQEQKYTVIVPKQWQPYYKLDENGEPTGFAIEVFEYVAKDIGLQYEYKIANSFKNFWKSYEDGTAQIVPDIGVSEKRESFSLFSIPTNTFNVSFFKRSNSYNIQSIVDLKGKLVGVVDRNVGQRVMDNYPDINKKIFSTHFEALTALLSGQISAVVYPVPLMYATLNTLNIQDKITHFGKPLLEIKRAIGISVDHEVLLEPINNSLEEFLKTNQYVQIHDKYFGYHHTLKLSKNETIVYGLVFLLLLISIISLFLRNRALVTQKHLQKELKMKTKDLNKSLDLYNYAFSVTQDGIWDWDVANSKVYFSPRWKSMLGYESDEIKDEFSEWERLVHPSDIEYARTEAFKLASGELKEYAINFRMICKDGSKKWILSRAKATVFDKEGKPSRIVGTHVDITKQKKHEKIIEDYMNIIDKNVLTTSTDINGKITSVSEAFCKLSGYSREELLGKTHRIMKHPDMDIDVFKQMWNILNMNGIWMGEIKNKKKDGGFFWVEVTISPTFDEDGKKIGYTSTRDDITAKKALEKTVITDGLTNIYNRRYFDVIFPKAINSAKRDNSIECFVLIDIDHFKQYNDTYGHQLGDKTLIQVAQTLQQSLNRADDYCFRLGGEEFGLLYRSDSKEKAILFANKIRKNIEKLKIEHKGNSASDYLTISLGLVCKEAKEIDSLDFIYKQADELLYQAKDSGRNQVKIN